MGAFGPIFGSVSLEAFAYRSFGLEGLGTFDTALYESC